MLHLPSGLNHLRLRSFKDLPPELKGELRVRMDKLQWWMEINADVGGRGVGCGGKGGQMRTA